MLSPYSGYCVDLIRRYIDQLQFTHHSVFVPIILSDVPVYFDCIVHEQVEEDSLVGEDRQIVTFKMETLIAATENFHDGNKLGEGGFGPVYKVTSAEKASTSF
jgi:hypothetical protein